MDVSKAWVARMLGEEARKDRDERQFVFEYVRVRCVSEVTWRCDHDDRSFEEKEAGLRHAR